MERSGTPRERTVSEEGVTVRQQYTGGMFDLPSVVLIVESGRAEPVTVRLVVRDLNTSAVGFHPEFESDAWTIEAGDLVFERLVEPGETVQTLYALDTDEESVFGRAMDSLDLDIGGIASGIGLDEDDTDGPTVEPGPTGVATRPDERSVETNSESTDTTETTAVTRAGSGGGDGDEPAAVGPDAWGPARADDDTNSGADTGCDKKAVTADTGRDDRVVDPAAAGVGVTDGGATEPRTTVGNNGAHSAGADDRLGGAEADTGLEEQPTERLVGELLDRFDDGDLSLAHREQLQVVGTGPAADAAHEARITDLQTRVSDVEAFTRPIEQLIEGYGSPVGAFESFDERLSAVEDQLGTAEQLNERVDELADSLESTVDRFDADIEAIERELDRVQSAVAEREQLRADVDATGEQVDQVAADLTAIDDSLSALDDRVQELSTDCESMTDDIDRLKTWREELASALQTGVGD